MMGMRVLFWISFILLGYTYIGYPLIVWIVGRRINRTVQKKELYPTVSFILVVHNEAQHIAEKLDNILSLDYPAEKLEILVGSDGCTDGTNDILQRYHEKGVKVFIEAQQAGKVKVLKELVACAQHEILVFSDARQRFDRNVLKNITAYFSDHNVGAVSGELILEGEEKSSVSKGVGFYWRYEKWMRLNETRIHSMVGATGAIYAIRRRLFVPPPDMILLDDVYIPLKVVEQGYRALFVTDAKAYDTASVTREQEFRRKVRTLAGNFQIFRACFNLFNLRTSKIAWQFFSHKFLRAIAFIFLIILFLANMRLYEDIFYRQVFVLQVLFYSCAILGWIMEQRRVPIKIFSFPYVFCILNIAALVGFINFIFGRQTVKWK